MASGGPEAATGATQSRGLSPRQRPRQESLLGKVPLPIVYLLNETENLLLRDTGSD